MNSASTFYFLYVKSEHQRYWWDIGQWTTTLVGTDPKAIVEETVRLAVDPNSGVLKLGVTGRNDLQPALDAAIASQKYNIETVVKSNATDKDGWRYAVDFSAFSAKSFFSLGSSHNKPGTMDYARRRDRVTIQAIDSAAGAAAMAAATAAVAGGAKGSDGDAKDSKDATSSSAAAATATTSAGTALSSAAVALPATAATGTASAAPVVAASAAVANAPTAGSGAGGGVAFTLHNVSLRMVYIARYELKNKMLWNRTSDPVGTLQFGEKRQLSIPSAALKVVINVSPSSFPEIVAVEEFKSMPQVMIGKTWFGTSTFYIKDGSTPGADVRVLDSVAYSVEPDLWVTRQQDAKAALAHNPSYSHWNEAARVRSFSPAAEPIAANRLCAAERAFRDVRMKSINTAAAKFLDYAKLAEADTPVIAFAFSGGGCRATTAAIGWTDTLISSGLYDCGLYCAGVSGGAWFTALWSASPNNWLTWVKNFQKNLSTSAFVQTPSSLQLVTDAVLRTAAFRPGHAWALPDLYGGMIAYEWFKSEWKENERLDLTCSEQALAPAFKLAERPLPIYNCVRPSRDLKDTIDDYEWIEFTPYEVAAHDSAVAIPTWSFGRQFKDGVSINSAPEQPFACLMGMFGSAMCASIEEMQRTVGVPNFIMDALRGIAPAAAKTRLVGMARNYNFMYGVNDAQSRALDLIDTVDAGVWVNCPIPSYYGRPERAVDIILAFDARPTENSDEKIAENDSKDVLRAFIAYCKLHKIKCPIPVADGSSGAIDKALKGVGIRYVTVFRDDTPGSTLPLIAYIPLIKNAAYDPKCTPHTQFNFMDFSYSEASFNSLKGLAAFNMKQILPEIKTVIKEIVERKRAARTAAAATAAVAPPAAGAGASVTVTVANPAGTAADATGVDPPQSISAWLNDAKN